MTFSLIRAGAMRRACLLAGAVAGFMFSFQAQAQSPDPLNIMAAGSLRGALDEIGTGFTQHTHIPVHMTYGPAGQLSRRIVGGERADLFLSANTSYPRQLVQDGLGQDPFVFIKNSLCFLVSEKSGLTEENIIPHILDPVVHIGISTPGSDPGGDYGWQVLSNLEQDKHLAPGSILYRARALVGGAVVPPIPQGANPVVYYLHSGQVDMFIAYCSLHALEASKDIRRISVPGHLTMPVDYAGTVLMKADHKKDAEAFKKELLSDHAQAIFQRYGFVAMAKKTNSK